MTAASRSTRWLPFLCGFAAGSALTAATLQAPMFAGAEQNDTVHKVPAPPEETPSGKAPEEVWNGSAAFVLAIDDREVRCRTEVEGRLRPQGDFGLLEGHLSAKDLECGAAGETAFVRSGVLGTDNHPNVSFVVLVGDVDRDDVTLVDQLILHGDRLMVDGVEVEPTAAGELRIVITFERIFLGLWTPTVDGREVGEEIRLEANLRRVEEQADA